jgi:hypothetical protein
MAADKTCQRCGAENLSWRKYERNWRLFEKGGRLHWCNRPTAAQLRKHRPNPGPLPQRRGGYRDRPRETRMPADRELHRGISKRLNKSKIVPEEPW